MAELYQQKIGAQAKLETIFEAIDSSSLVKGLNIPQSNIKLLAELSLFRKLSFVKCSKMACIANDDDDRSVVTKTSSDGWGYPVATTDGVFSSGIHRYEVLVGPTPRGGCRYIGYISCDGAIRYEKGMFACDYYVGWDGEDCHR